MLHDYPYTNAHELNLDWVLSKIIELNNSMTSFVALNTISFKGPWNINIAYTAWSLVDNGGYGYISQKPVPAGIDINNEEYWIKVSDYSALLSEFNQRLTAIEHKVNKRYLFMGDSYSQFDYNWIDAVCQNLGLTIGQNAFKIGAPSRGFIGDTSQGDMSYLKLLQDNIGSITEPETITDIIVCGGINDAYASEFGSDLIQAVRTFCIYCKSVMPVAKIHCGIIGFTNNKEWLANLVSVNFCYTQGIGQYGCMINNAPYLWHYTGWLMDSVHPNQYGMEYIANGITGYLLNGNCHPQGSNKFDQGAGTLSGSLEGGGSFTYLSKLIDNMVSINVKIANNISNTNFTCSDNWQEIGTIGNSFFVGGNHDFTNSAPGCIRLYDTTSNIYYEIPCNFAVVGQKLYVQCPSKGRSGTSDLVINVGQVKIDVNITTPALGN